MIEIYQDPEDQRFYFKLKSKSGKTLAVSETGYKSKRGIYTALDSIFYIVREPRDVRDQTEKVS